MTIPLIFTAALLILIFVISINSHPLSDEKAIDAIVGEAANQDFDTMVYIAHAIRNRHSLHGVYGMGAKHNKTEPKWVWTKAKTAWEFSRIHFDSTHGATGFYSKDDIAKFGLPHNVHQTAKSGDFVFFKIKR